MCLIQACRIRGNWGWDSNQTGKGACLLRKLRVPQNGRALVSWDLETLGSPQKQQAGEQPSVQGRVGLRPTGRRSRAHLVRGAKSLRASATGGLGGQIRGQRRGPQSTQTAPARGLPTEPGSRPTELRLRSEDLPRAGSKTQTPRRGNEGVGIPDVSAHTGVVRIPG